VAEDKQQYPAMKSPFFTKLTLSICALSGGVLISSASAKPFKLFSHDHDRDRDRDRESEDAAPKVYIVTDEAVPSGSTGIVRVVPAPGPEVVPAQESRPVLVPEHKSRKSKSGETRYLEPVVVPPETTSGEALVPRKAIPVEEPGERITTTEEKQAPVNTSRSSSRKESVSTTRKTVQQPQRDEEDEVKTKVATSRHKDRDVPATTKRDQEDEVKTRVATSRHKDRDMPATPKHEAVEESTSTSVVRANNPLMPNPAATEERKFLVPDENPALRQETTATREVTTSRSAPSVQQAPPEAPAPEVEKTVSSTPTPEVPTLTAPSDYASASESPRAPANLPPGSIEKTGSKRSSADIPVAEKTDKPGFVKTPFTPKKLIDVRGMASGSLAKDPSTNQVFRVP
jgi:hypothetical protein